MAGSVFSLIECTEAQKRCLIANEATSQCKTVEASDIVRQMYDKHCTDCLQSGGFPFLLLSPLLSASARPHLLPFLSLSF